MLNLYLEDEAKQQKVVSESDKLSHSVFNLYEKPTFPEQREVQ
jgi:hypothetical protein